MKKNASCHACSIMVNAIRLLIHATTSATCLFLAMVKMSEANKEFAISNNDSVLYDLIVKNDLEKCLEIPKHIILRELHYRFRTGVLGQCLLHVAVLSASVHRGIFGVDFTRRHNRAVEIIKWLLQAGAEIEVENELGSTPVKSAISSADVVTVSLLVSAGARIFFEKSDSYGQSALHLACMGLRNMNNECFKLIQYLIQQRVDVSHRDTVCFVLCRSISALLSCAIHMLCCVNLGREYCLGQSITSY